jgi:adenosylhomocysteine nucleosidase
MTTTLILDHFRPDRILFTGIAGSLNDSLFPGDIVIGERTVQHDLVVIQDEGRERFGVRNPLNADRNPVFFPADDHLLSTATEAALDLRLAEVLTSAGRRIPRVARGTIATGDAFLASAEKKAEIAGALGADAVEMEGAAVAQICHQHGIPCLVIRSISDHADADADEHLERFYAIAARNSAMLVLEILEQLEDGPDSLRSATQGE